VGGAGGTAGASFGCALSVMPTGPLITDFSTSGAGGGAIPIVVAYRDWPYGASPPTTTLEAGAWHVTLNAPSATTPQYFGVGFDLYGTPEGTGCIDASLYTGIRFRIVGSVPSGCALSYSVYDSAHRPASKDPRATADELSYPPQAALAFPTATPSTFSFPFSGAGAPLGGNPANGIDRTKLLGLQWQIVVPAGAVAPCVVDFTLDDITFY